VRKNTWTPLAVALSDSHTRHASQDRAPLTLATTTLRSALRTPCLAVRRATHARALAERTGQGNLATTRRVASTSHALRAATRAAEPRSALPFWAARDAFAPRLGLCRPQTWPCVATALTSPWPSLLQPRARLRLAAVVVKDHAFGLDAP